MGEDIGGWQVVLHEPSPLRAWKAAAGVLAFGVAVAIGMLVVGSMLGIAVAALSVVAAVAVGWGVRQSDLANALVVRRNGEQLLCDRGGVRVFTAPIGEIRDSRVVPAELGARLVLERHELSRRYEVPGTHDPELLEALRAKIDADRKASEREREAPAELQALREAKP